MVHHHSIALRGRRFKADFFVCLVACVVCAVRVVCACAFVVQAHSHVWGGTREINKKSTSRLFETGCIHVWDSVNKKLKKTFKLSPPPQLPGLLTMPVPLAMVYHSNHVWVASDPIILCFDPYVRPLRPQEQSQASLVVEC
jgi:hypothetical protein